MWPLLSLISSRQLSKELSRSPTRTDISTNGTPPAATFCCGAINNFASIFHVNCHTPLMDIWLTTLNLECKLVKYIGLVDVLYAPWYGEGCSCSLCFKCESSYVVSSLTSSNNSTVSAPRVHSFCSSSWRLIRCANFVDIFDFFRPNHRHKFWCLYFCSVNRFNSFLAVGQIWNAQNIIFK